MGRTAPISGERIESIWRLIRENKLEQAHAAAMRLVRSAPRDPEAARVMASVLQKSGRHEQALYYAQQAVAAEPAHESGQSLLATILLALGRREDALSSIRAARALSPSNHFHAMLEATILTGLSRLEEAVKACRVEGEIPFHHPEIAITAANAMIHLGDHDFARNLLLRAMEANPEHAVLASTLCNSTLYVPGLSSLEIAEAHRRYGRLIERKHRASPGRITDPDPDRRLRIGILSPDLRRHSVGYFIEPLFEHHDPSEIELIAFDTSAPGQSDGITERLMSKASLWRRITPRSVEEFAATIRRDRIDVLIELSGHTTAHALEVMPYGPAPVRMTYLGYPCTTGLACMEYRIVDGTTDPVPMADACSTERLIRLEPCFVCYRPPDNPPSVERSPASESSGAGGAVFGSFNSAQKLNRPLIALWSRLLVACPGSALLLKAIAYQDESARNRVLAEFARNGIGPERLRVLPPEPGFASHLSRYNEVDISLDTFPYHGTTTTCESLLMGVPVVTMMGDHHASRVGGSLMKAAGMEHLVCGNEREFLRVACDLASHARALASQRQERRNRFLASPLCDGAAFARRFTNAVRVAWREQVRASVGARRS